MTHATLESSAIAAQEPKPIIVLSVSVISTTGNGAHSRATIRASIAGVEDVYSAEADDVGPIEAICLAFARLSPAFGWQNYSSRALGEGVDAAALSVVTLVKDDKTFSGQGKHRNTLHADAEAVADALHKLRWHEWNVERKRRR